MTLFVVAKVDASLRCASFSMTTARSSQLYLEKREVSISRQGEVSKTKPKVSFRTQ